MVESNKSLDRNKVELYNYFKKEIAKHRADGYISLAEVEEKEGSNRYLRSAQNLYYNTSSNTNTEQLKKEVNGHIDSMIKDLKRI